MAGKLHANYTNYNTSVAQAALLPQGKQFKAYAEGYNAARGGALQTTNPHPSWQNAYSWSDWTAWDRGWQDKTAGYPSTHVG